MSNRPIYIPSNKNRKRQRQQERLTPITTKNHRHRHHYDDDSNDTDTDTFKETDLNNNTIQIKKRPITKGFVSSSVSALSFHNDDNEKVHERRNTKMMTNHDTNLKITKRNRNNHSNDNNNDNNDDDSSSRTNSSRTTTRAKPANHTSVNKNEIIFIWMVTMIMMMIWINR